ncbi:MAG: aminoglycoside N(3)-acetyltransferase [Halolamina sp.]
MGERAAIERMDDPLTVDRIAADLRALGVEAGETLVVHASLSELGWVAGGPQAVVDAFQRVLTENGTIVMPTHSTQYSDPSVWSNPPVPDNWVEQIREGIPPYRPEVTPSRSMGAIAECFRTYPGAVRSRHPLYSFAAWGAEAEAIVTDHPFGNAIGDDSPLGRVYDRGGRVLMLGTEYQTNTSLHLAEYRGEFETEPVSEGAPVLRDGERTWVEWEDIAISSEDFPEVGAAFEAANPDAVVEGTVGAATAKLLDQRRLVEFAADWFAEHR